MSIKSSLFYAQVEGVEGIMAAYAKALNNVSLAGPTLFGQVINKAAELAGQSASYDYRKYFVLLIITVHVNELIISISLSLFLFLYIFICAHTFL